MMPPGGILVDKVTMANMQVTCYECQKTRCMRPVLIAWTQPIMSKLFVQFLEASHLVIP